MSKFQSLRSNSSKPAFLEAAEAAYGEAFEARTRKELADAMNEWADLTDEEQRFAQTHLMYLNLQAQGAIARTQVQIRELLEEIAAGFGAAIELLDRPETPVEEPEAVVPEVVDPGGEMPPAA